MAAIPPASQDKEAADPMGDEQIQTLCWLQVIPEDLGSQQIYEILPTPTMQRGRNLGDPAEPEGAPKGKGRWADPVEMGRGSGWIPVDPGGSQRYLGTSWSGGRWQLRW